MKTRKIVPLLIALLIVSLGFAQPTTSATTPTKLAADVKSVFSDAYTNISTVELFPDWGQGTKYVNYVIPASSPANNVIKYSNLDYQGINITVGGNPPGVDFSAMTTLHIDVWTPDVASFKLFPIDDKTDLLFKTLTPTQAGWNSYDIVLATDFPTLNKSSIRQFKFEKTALKYKAEVNTIYFDNIYFWKAPSPAGTPTISFTIPAKFSSDASFSLSSLVSSDSPGSFMFTSSNTSVATISGSTLTIKGAGTAVITANQAAIGSFIAGSKTADLIVSNPDPVPSTAAPVPPNRNAGDVKSFFSNKYTNIPIDTWSASWDDSDVTDVQIAGDDTKKILFTNILGIDFSSLGNHQELSAMTHFHMDFWTANPNLVGRAMNVKLVDFGGTPQEQTSMLLHMEEGTNPKLESGKWVSIDVPLTAFTAGNSSQTRSDIAQLLLVSNLNAVYAPDEAFPGGVVVYGALLTDKSKVYVDNIYLYKGTALATGTPAPIALAQKLCNAATVASLVATGTDLKWYDISIGGTALSSDVALVSGTYFVSQTLNNLESDRTPVLVNVITTIPNAGNNGTLSVCAGTTPSETRLFDQLGGTPDTDGSWSGPTDGVYTYTVAATSPCTIAASATVTLTFEPLPSAPVSNSVTYCQNQTATALTASGITTVTTNWYDDPSAVTPYINAPTPNTNAVGTFNYYVSQTAANGCESDRALLEVIVYPIYNASICYVTSDETETIKNRIYINNNGNYNVDTYQIFREGDAAGVYDLIGELGSNQNSFLDLEVDNSASSYKYKVKTKDISGLVSNDSSTHKTILLQSSLATNNNVNLSWTTYDGIGYGTYTIYRKVNDGVFEFLKSTSASNLSYTDVTANTSLNKYSYYVSIAIAPCSTSSGTKLSNRNAALTSQIRSNYKIISKQGALGIEDNTIDLKIKVYPNPVKNTIAIEGGIIDNIANQPYTIIDAVGKIVLKGKLNEGDTTINVEGLSKGIYCIKVANNKASKFIKE